MQLPLATGKSFTIDGLREKLRELFRQEVGAELRAGAALNNVESYRAHFFQLAGRPYRPSVAHSQRGGFAADYLGRKQALAASASEQSGASGNLQMTTATLARARCSVFTRSTWETSTAVPGQSARANIAPQVRRDYLTGFAINRKNVKSLLACVSLNTSNNGYTEFAR